MTKTGKTGKKRETAPKAAQTAKTTRANAAQAPGKADEQPVFMLYGFMLLLTILALIGFRLSTSQHGGPLAMHVTQYSDEQQRTANADTDATRNSHSGGNIRPGADAPPPACRAEAFGPGREIPLNSETPPQLGLVQFPDTLPLEAGEVVFTFDDGPHPVRTPVVLDILDRHCIKAVFFMIGKMAQEHPEMVREVARRGHVIGTHTWSHPLNLAHMAPARAEEEIERGFTAVSDALGKPAAPLFRFPGLAQSHHLLDYLASRNIGVWSVDVVAGDTERRSRGRLAATVMRRLTERGRGILLFHDIQNVTLDHLETIIEDLSDAGYRPVHVLPTQEVTPAPEQVAQLRETKPQPQPRAGRARHR